MLYTLGPSKKAWFGSVELRLNKDLRNCVAYVGYVANDDAGERQFLAGGTGFFLQYKGACYFVTARHVAEALEPPFALRATNDKDEPVLIEDIVHAGWFFHPNESVDLAIVIGIPTGVSVLSPSLLLTPELAVEKDVGIGDETYIVGLYRLLHGKKKNLPIVHSGNIAMVPQDEKIPQRNQTTGEVKYVEGYLIESQTLEGLSGSPVFVRHVWGWQVGEQHSLLLGDVYLLGVWSGAWDAPPGEVLALERPEAKRVPVGMGIAVPAYKLLELLEMPEVVENRNRRIAEEGAVNEDSALPRPEKQEPPTTDENPQGKEDFNSLLDAAVSGSKPNPETS